ncbi:MAG: hypothetical protein ABJH98_05170 [Reichenbachiella sp.]|uniref:hypothetical protein n=1 Tax=Reichenbachiella sp. TaxID=2184521 RepID=UPI003297CFC3
MMKSKIVGVVVLLWSTLAFGQEFKFTADLPVVADSGYYRVLLSPELLGRTANDWSDLRVFDNEGEEQAYIKRNESKASTRSLFKEYEITDKAYKQDAISHLIFSNPTKEPIDNISFLVKNTDVKKRARLSGSDDLENWYVIKDNYLLHAMQSEEKTSEMKMLNFPLSDYGYFKLEINDNWKLPINILKVGYYDTQQVKGLSTRFNCPIISQRDSLKQSTIHIKFPEPRYLEELQLVLSGEEFYLRQAHVLVKREGVDRKKNKYEYFHSIGLFELNSNSENKMAFRGTVAQELQIQIDNRDNHPLKVESVSASYLNKYLVVELLPSMTYSMKLGDKSLVKPDYDLKAFASQIPANIPLISHGVIENIASIEDPVQKGFWNNKYLVWFVIAVVGFALIYISLKMVKEIGK